MQKTTLKPYLKMLELRRAPGRLLKNEKGQDLIEYALVVALIAFAAAAGMSSVASKINDAYTNVGTKVSTYTS
jgi:pilus assembly protein Flp/PilA